MASRTRLAVVALAVAVALVGSACSGGGGGTSDEPIVLGLINTENSPIGTFPELRADAEAAVRHVNEDRDGVDGRTLRLETCAVNGTAESTAACAERLVALRPAPVAVLGGVDLHAGAAIPVLDRAKVPFVGMTPGLGDELGSPLSFLLSGGVATDLLAQTEFITGTLKATKVGVVHLDLPGLQDAAILVARAILQKRGVTDLQIFSEKAEATDLTTAVRRATANSPQALMVAFPPSGCARVLAAVRQLRTTARVFLPGACANGPVLEAARTLPAANAVTFATSLLPPTDTADPDVALWQRERDGGIESSTAAQAGFALVMDTVRLLDGLEDADRTAAGLTVALRATRDQPAFMGHAYSCDGRQVRLLSSVCSGWARIARYTPAGTFADEGGGWITGAPLVELLTS